jgi:hypothetical protein
MHDIDRTQLEWEQYETPGYELAQEAGGFSSELAMHETSEMELAAELLEITNEAELEQFLGKLFNTVGNTLGTFARTDTGRALLGGLRDAARQAVPTIGRAVGNWIAPGRGGPMGGQLAQQAGALLGLELEGLSPPDQEFEVARQFVRFAGNAYANAAAAPPAASPAVAAQQALAAAAQQYAPGLVQSEDEFGRHRGARGRAYSPRPFRRAYRPQPRPYPVYGGWTTPVADPTADEPQWGGDGASAGPTDEPADEPYLESIGSNGYPAGARSGRWVKRGRVVILYGV